MDIIIKPHHLLDIFKLYGRGIEEFVPDEKFNHNFYYIGNAVIQNKIDKIKFTYEKDDICKPCKYLIEGTCSDSFKYEDVFYSKNKYNEKIDTKLLRALNLDIHTAYTFKKIVILLNDQLTQELINIVWYNNTREENTVRYTYTKSGINKYISKFC